MDLTIPLEGASGGVATLVLYGLAQLVRSKVNGNRNSKYPCERHAERLASLEASIKAVAVSLEHLTNSQNANYAASRTAESAAIVVLNEQGERIASLEATSVSSAAGILRIEVSLKEIEKALHERRL